MQKVDAKGDVEEEPALAAVLRNILSNSRRAPTVQVRQSDVLAIEWLRNPLHVLARAQWRRDVDDLIG